MVRIKWVISPTYTYINGVYGGYNPLILTIDPNLLGHPSWQIRFDRTEIFTYTFSKDLSHPRREIFHTLSIWVRPPPPQCHSTPPRYEGRIRGLLRDMVEMVHKALNE